MVLPLHWLLLRLLLLPMILLLIWCQIRTTCLVGLDEGLIIFEELLIFLPLIWVDPVFVATARLTPPTTSGSEFPVRCVVVSVDSRWGDYMNDDRNASCHRNIISATELLFCMFFKIQSPRRVYFQKNFFFSRNRIFSRLICFQIMSIQANTSPSTFANISRCCTSNSSFFTL